MLKNCTKS